jgi:hypothetical protein
MRTLGVMAVLFAVPALAHIALRTPMVRYADQKVGPCGKGTLDARTSRVTTYTAGDTIDVVWDETINHPGHYRVSFDVDGQDFYLPRSFTEPRNCLAWRKCNPSWPRQSGASTSQRT